MLFWTKYPGAKFATFLSIVGALTLYGGVLCAFAGLILPGIITAAVGLGIQYLAKMVAAKKAASAANKAAAKGE